LQSPRPFTIGKKKKAQTNPSPFSGYYCRIKSIQRSPRSRTTLLSCSESNLAIIGLLSLLASVTNGGTGYLVQHTAVGA